VLGLASMLGLGDVPPDADPTAGDGDAEGDSAEPGVTVPEQALITRLLRTSSDVDARVRARMSTPS
jgi:hypothetical protein